MNIKTRVQWKSIYGGNCFVVNGPCQRFTYWGYRGFLRRRGAKYGKIFFEKVHVRTHLLTLPTLPGTFTWTYIYERWRWCGLRHKSLVCFANWSLQALVTPDKHLARLMASAQKMSYLSSIQHWVQQSSRFDDNFSYFSSKPYVVTPHLNRLVETAHMRGRNICFKAN